MRIVKVSPATYEAVHALAFSHMTPREFEEFTTANPEPYRFVQELLRGEKGIGLVAEVDGQVVGYLLGGDKLNNLSPIRYAELYQMRVTDVYQRQGIGTALVKAFLEWTQEEGYGRVSVEVSVKSEKNRLFYQHVGFVAKTIMFER